MLSVANMRQGIKTTPAKPHKRADSIMLQGFFAMGAGMLLLLLLWFPELHDLSLQTLCNITSACVLLVLLGVAHTSVRGFWSASFSYIFVFCLFHFGLTFALGIGAFPDDQREQFVYRWLNVDYAKDAVLLACIGLISCGIGTVTANITKPKARQASLLASTSEEHLVSANEEQLASVFQVVGFVLVTSSILTWLLVVITSGGIGLLVASYSNFLETTESSGIGLIAYWGIALGMAFLALSKPTKLRRWGFIIFSLWALLAFPLGLRGEVLFASTTALVIVARRKIPLSALKASVLVLCLLVAIAAVKNLRQVGVSGFASEDSSSQVGTNPLDALIELGYSLRPVAEVVKWHDNDIDFLYGASYWAPIDRSLVYIIPGWTRVPAEEDDRILSNPVTRQFGAIGFSPVAEAYHNFGIAGVVIVMFITGLLLGRMDLWRGTSEQLALVGVIFSELLFNVRNNFTPLPSHIAVGIILIYVIKTAFRRRAPIKRKVV